MDIHPSCRVFPELLNVPTNPYQGQTYVDAITGEVLAYWGATWQVLHTLTPADALLVEAGDLLLQENGYKILLS